MCDTSTITLNQGTQNSTMIYNDSSQAIYEMCHSHLQFILFILVFRPIYEQAFYHYVLFLCKAVC